MSKIVVLDDRAVLRVSGADAKSFLQGLVTNDVARLAPAQAVYAALLTAQGKIITDFIALTDGVDILVDVAALQAEDLAARLRKFKLRAKVTVGEVNDSLAVISALEAPPAGAGAIAASADPRLAELGWRWIVERQALASIDVEPEPHATYDRHRIECGVPDSIMDLRPETFFPLDCNFEELHGVDFNKGCYVGQELTARMKHRATARRRILPVAAAAALPAHGTPLRLGEAVVGEMLGSQGPRGLASLRLDRLGEATSVTTDDGQAIQVGRPPYTLAI